jgi:hypothetical protein
MFASIKLVLVRLMPVMSIPDKSVVLKLTPAPIINPLPLAPPVFRTIYPVGSVAVVAPVSPPLRSPVSVVLVKIVPDISAFVIFAFARLLLVKFALVSATPDKSTPVNVAFCIDKRGPNINPFVAVFMIRATYPVGRVAVVTPIIPPPMTALVNVAPVRFAFVSVDDVNVALFKNAPVRFAFVILADVSVVLVIFAVVNTAPVRFADVKLLPNKNALVNVVLFIVTPVYVTEFETTFVMFAFVSVDDEKLVPVRVAPDKSIPVIFTLVIVCDDSAAPTALTPAPIINPFRATYPVGRVAVSSPVILPD